MIQIAAARVVLATRGITPKLSHALLQLRVTEEVALCAYYHLQCMASTNSPSAPSEGLQSFAQSLRVPL